VDWVLVCLFANGLIVNCAAHSLALLFSLGPTHKEYWINGKQAAHRMSTKRRAGCWCSSLTDSVVLKFWNSIRLTGRTVISGSALLFSPVCCWELRQGPTAVLYSGGSHYTTLQDTWTRVSGKGRASKHVAGDVADWQTYFSQTGSARHPASRH